MNPIVTIVTIVTDLTRIVGGRCMTLSVSRNTLRDSRDDQEHRIKEFEDERTRDKAEFAE